MNTEAIRKKKDSCKDTSTGRHNYINASLCGFDNSRFASILVSRASINKGSSSISFLASTWSLMTPSNLLLLLSA